MKIKHKTAKKHFVMYVSEIIVEVILHTYLTMIVSSLYIKIFSELKFENIYINLLYTRKRSYKMSIIFLRSCYLKFHMQTDIGDRNDVPEKIVICYDNVDENIKSYSCEVCQF